jgi:SAM-dependent methyltransferase
MITSVMSTPHLFDRKSLVVNRRRAMRAGLEVFLLERVTQELVDRLSAVKRRFLLALDLGTPGDELILALKKSDQVDRLIAYDALGDLRQPSTQRVIGDEEALPFGDQKFDLVVSALSLQWINDLPGTLLQIRQILKPDGLMLIALIGGETLKELRESLATAESEISGGISPRVSPFAEVRTLGQLLLRAGFALPVVDFDRQVVRYSHALELFHDLRRMGATNVLVERSRKPLTRKMIRRTSEIYAEQFADADGRVRATFDVLWLSGWAPHESQQKPLKPGSAKTRLADALDTSERPAGEKTGH